MDKGEGISVKQKETEKRTAFELALETIENDTKPEARSRPDFIRTPFEESTTIIENQIPHLTAIADTHLAGPQPFRGGEKAITHGKRRVLAKFPSIRKRIREMAVLTRFALRQAAPEINKRFEKGGLMLIMGDVVVANEAGAVFYAYHDLERYYTARNKAVGMKNKDNQIRVFKLSGNHNRFLGPEEYWGSRALTKDFGMFGLEDFRSITKAVKEGKSWEVISRAWNRYRREGVENDNDSGTKLAIHSVHKWYLELLTHGSQIGSIETTDDKEKVNNQVAFIDSELMQKNGGVVALKKALNQVNIPDNDPLHGEMVNRLKSEMATQKKLINQILVNSQNGAKTTIYSHCAVTVQDNLIKAFQVQRDLTKKEAKDFIQNNFLIFGGHRHLGKHDYAPGRERKGAVHIQGMTREVIGPVIQTPFKPEKGKVFPMSLGDPYKSGDIDYPEIVVGSADKPEIKKIPEVKEMFKARFPK